MKYLIINIVLILVSATILHLLLFKKFLKQDAGLDLIPKMRFKFQIGEVVPVLMAVVLLMQFEEQLIGHKPLLILFVISVLILLMRVVRVNER